MYIPHIIARACTTSTIASTSTGAPAPDPSASSPAPAPEPTAPVPPPVPAITDFDWSVPEAWDKPNVPTGYGDLQGTVQDAINGLRDYWSDPNAVEYTWDVGTTLSALAYKDTVASTRDNYDYVKAALQHAKDHDGNFDPFAYNDDSQWWGTTAMYAHRAYGDQEFLDWAIDVWNHVAPSQITEDQANQGMHPLRPNPIQGQCNGKSTAGGVFWRAEQSDRTDMDVNVITTSLFETLSAYLAEATGDQKYLDAAKAAYNFIVAHMLQDSPNIPIDTLKMADCGTNNWIFTYNAGKFIEGTAILAKLTNDDGMKEQLFRTINDAVKHTDNWQNAQGHITEGRAATLRKVAPTDSIYLRALTETYRRYYDMPSMRDLLRTYVAIQWQSITSNDRNGNKYGIVWSGPYTEAAWGQANVLDALVAGLEMNWAR
ncbi:Six-hairpin glycosidase-like protein [Auriculariales sp. MPI-PUGE-AT-0066]|nr:Six-hairpin glycosidase-like protein [Auriculariales sp. MPI-PUGE-AT-0066]